MSDSGKGSLESKSAAFSIYVHSLDNYISEVVASNRGKNATDVPKQVNTSIQKSIQANIDYHDYMRDANSNVGDTNMFDYHTAMADTYRTLKTK